MVIIVAIAFMMVSVVIICFRGRHNSICKCDLQSSSLLLMLVVVVVVVDIIVVFIMVIVVAMVVKAGFIGIISIAMLIMRRYMPGFWK